MTVSFEMSLQVNEVRLNVYSVFDFFRDVGGLLFFVLLLVSFVRSVTTFNKSENYLVS